MDEIIWKTYKAKAFVIVEALDSFQRRTNDLFARILIYKIKLDYKNSDFTVPYLLSIS